MDSKQFGEYRVFSDGTIYSSISRRKLKGFDNNGYRAIDLVIDGENKRFYVHRLVASVLIENPNDLPCINHKDLDKSNNSIENLEWCTHRQNSQHALKAGVLGTGGTVPIISEVKLEAFKILHSFGFSQRKLAETFGVTQACISKTIKRNGL